MKILITGALGWTAQSIVQDLHAAGCRVFGIDLPGKRLDPDAPYEAVFYGDVADGDFIAASLEGVDALVHLAIAGSPEKAFRTNVEGTYRAFEAARLNGLQKVVLMGSAPVHLAPVPGLVLDARRGCLSGPGGDFQYDLTKCLQESMARQFCETYGMTAVTLRAGHIVDGEAAVDPKGRPLSELTYSRGGWVDRQDLARAVTAALTRWNGQGYEAFHVIGARQALNHFDVGRAEEELGITFQYRFENYD